MRKTAILFCVANIVISMLLSGCATVNKAERTAVIGSAAGGAVGALIGKRAGNTAIGAAIGTVIGASTGAYIGKRLDSFSGHKGKNAVSPLYVINGVLFLEKDAQNMLSSIKPGSIESIVVLKTEEAIALYGEKGQHGAILIDL